MFANQKALFKIAKKICYDIAVFEWGFRSQKTPGLIYSG